MYCIDNAVLVLFLNNKVSETCVIGCNIFLRVITLLLVYQLTFLISLGAV